MIKAAFNFDVYICEFSPFLSDIPCIDYCFCWAEEAAFKVENVLCASKYSNIEILESNYSSSWLLARLWYMTEGKIVDCLNLNDYYDINKYNNCDGVGGQDGGTFYSENGIIRLASNNEVIATFYTEGYTYKFEDELYAPTSYATIKFKECLERFDPYEIMTKLSNKIWEDPKKISICHIVIKDPEKNNEPYHYGWDGTSFFFGNA